MFPTESRLVVDVLGNKPHRTIQQQKIRSACVQAAEAIADTIFAPSFQNSPMDSPPARVINA